MKTQLDETQTDYLRKIQSSGRHLLGIINDVLDFSKIEAGKLNIENVEIHFEDILQNLVNFVGNKAAEKNIEILFEVDPNLPKKCVGDPLRVGQILINYLNNAIKFTDEGEIIIKVHVMERHQKRCFIKFQVQDPGIGLSQDQQHKIFNSFEQADSSTTRQYGGTGLGLAICKRLANLMDGDVGVESELGKGSRFWFTVGMDVIEDKDESRLVDIGLRNLHVLVVDDSDNARSLMQEMLGAMSFKVESVSSGEEALKINSKSG